MGTKMRCSFDVVIGSWAMPMILMFVVWASLSSLSTTAITVAEAKESATTDTTETRDISNNNKKDSGPCAGGTCPFPSTSATVMKSSISALKDEEGLEDEEQECGLWMGPSDIKEKEEHGFGLGFFTGKAIPKGTAIEIANHGHGEVLLPIYGSDHLYEENSPPLREYIWDEENIPEAAVEYPYRGTSYFVPGLATIAPCTSQNYNLRLGDDRGWSATNDDTGVHRWTHPHAGAFSYRHNVSYVAVRDIAAGEELTVFCEDDNFDGGVYHLSQYDESAKSDEDTVTCVDRNLRVDVASKSASTSSDYTNKNKDKKINNNDPMGLGVFAKRSMKKDETIISSPLIPIHRKELDVKFCGDDLYDDCDDDELLKKEKDLINHKQLMLNYAFGHPDSDLLMLPNGPMVSYINHKQKKTDDGNDGPNAEIRWHQKKTKNNDSKKSRSEYHNTELFNLMADQVAVTHGKGLVIDIVATRDIRVGEEIYLDYGPEWQSAWDEHVAAFDLMKQQSKLSQKSKKYVSADRQMKIETDVVPSTSKLYYRMAGFEQKLDPYSESTEFFCFYHLHNDDYYQLLVDMGQIEFTGEPDDNNNSGNGGNGETTNLRSSSSMRMALDVDTSSFDFEDDDEIDDDDDDDETIDGYPKMREFSWENHNHHTCFRPCTIIERYSPDDNDDDEVADLKGDDYRDDDDVGYDGTNEKKKEPYYYTVQMFRIDNERVQDSCGISSNYIYNDVPQSEIRLLDRPYTTDVLRPMSFRHEIGVPDGFYPDLWLNKKRKLRSSRKSSSNADNDNESYKRIKSQSKNK